MIDTSVQHLLPLSAKKYLHCIVNFFRSRLNETMYYQNRQNTLCKNLILNLEMYLEFAFYVNYAGSIAIRDYERIQNETKLLNIALYFLTKFANLRNYKIVYECRFIVSFTHCQLSSITNSFG